jgi:hypothetical protein
MVDADRHVAKLRAQLAQVVVTVDSGQIRGAVSGGMRVPP